MTNYQDVNESRVQNILQLIRELGMSQKEFSQKLNYENSAFLSQMVGPKKSRPISEKTARKIEQIFGLSLRSLDVPPDSEHSLRGQGKPFLEDRSLAVLRAVAEECEATKVNLSPQKLLKVVELVCADMTHHDDALRPTLIRDVVCLFKD